MSHLDERVRELMRSSSEPELEDALRLAEQLRGADLSRTEAWHPPGAARRLDRRLRSQLGLRRLQVVEDVLRHLLARAQHEDSFLFLGRPRVPWREAWVSWAMDPGLSSCTPEPGEGALSLASRLLTQLEAQGLAPDRVRLWQARADWLAGRRPEALAGWNGLVQCRGAQGEQACTDLAAAALEEGEPLRALQRLQGRRGSWLADWARLLHFHQEPPRPGPGEVPAEVPACVLACARVLGMEASLAGRVREAGPEGLRLQAQELHAVRVAAFHVRDGYALLERILAPGTDAPELETWRLERARSWRRPGALVLDALDSGRALERWGSPSASSAPGLPVTMVVPRTDGVAGWWEATWDAAPTVSLSRFSRAFDPRSIPALNLLSRGEPRLRPSRAAEPPPVARLSTRCAERGHPLPRGCHWSLLRADGSGRWTTVGGGGERSGAPSPGQLQRAHDLAREVRIEEERLLLLPLGRLGQRAHVLCVAFDSAATWASVGRPERREWTTILCDRLRAETFLGALEPSPAERLVWPLEVPAFAELAQRVVQAGATARRLAIVGPAGTGKALLARWASWCVHGELGTAWRDGGPLPRDGVLLVRDPEHLGLRSRTALLHDLEVWGRAPVLFTSRRLPHQWGLTGADGERLAPDVLRVPALDARRLELGAWIRSLLEREAQRLSRSTPQLTESAHAWLWREAWPGGLRQLQEACTVLVRRAGEDAVGVAALEAWLAPLGIRRGRRLRVSPQSDHALTAALEVTRTRGGRRNLAAAARLMGWDPKSVRKGAERLGIPDQHSAR